VERAALAKYRLTRSGSLLAFYTGPMPRPRTPAPQPRPARQTPTSILDGMLAAGLKHQQQGRLADAERIYRQILAIDSRHAGSLHLLGTLAHQVGWNEVAAQLMRAAVGIDPGHAAYHANLGTVLQAQGRLDESAAAYQQALERNPNLAEAHMNLGTVRHAQGRQQEAAACFRNALALRPDLAEAAMNLGNILQDQGKLAEAAASHEQALAMRPDFAEAFYNLGNVRHTQQLLCEAAACYQRALELKPNLAEAHYNLGNTRQAQDDLTAAADCFIQALVLRPRYAEAHYNLGCVLQQMGQLDEALPHFQEAVDGKPGYAQARFGQALAQIQSGDFERGWRNYESRWQSIDHETPMRAYPQPLWTGELLPAGRLLLWGEQGVGDEIMFAGLVRDAIRSGNRIMLDCDPRLNPLFARSFPSVEVVSSAARPGAASEKASDPFRFTTAGVAAHLPTGSLPGLFRASQPFSQTPTRTPSGTDLQPYLKADSAEREQFRTRYADGRRLVGLAWHTRNQKTGRKRCTDLAALAPLFALPGIRWISLQYGEFDALAQEAAAASFELLIDRSVDQLLDIDRFAAQVAAMDQVLTIDNSTAHLAGALGVPVWLMLPYAANWRWLLNRTETPWYGSMRLYRQPSPGDWQSVIGTVHADLASDLQ
jgi:tetratricopeptide (TPR) repeat protein